MAQAEFNLGVTLPLEKGLTEREDGDLIIEGLAADYSIDRQGEAFAPGCFEKAIGKFLERGAPLMYHHQHDKQLGQVLDLQSRADGLFIKAIIPKPADGSPLVDIYNKIKRGMMKGVSVFGSAERAMTPDGMRIVDTDLQEISITPMPVGPNSLIGVAQKAFPADFPCSDCGSSAALSPEEERDLRARLDEKYEGIVGRLAKAVLNAKMRGNLPASSFVFPKERRYPIHDRAHAANALARSAGKPEAAKVRAAVCKKFPDLPACKS